MARGVQVLGELLIQGAAAAVGVPGHPGGRHPEQRERVHARVGVEPVVFGRHQGLREILRNRRAGVSDVVLGRLGRGQGGGLAGRGSERVQQDNHGQEHGDHDGCNLDDPEGQPELPAAPAPLVPPGERARRLVVDVFVAFAGGRAASAKYPQLPSPPSVRTRLPLASTSGPPSPCPAHRNFLPSLKHVCLAAGRGERQTADGDAAEQGFVSARHRGCAKLTEPICGWQVGATDCIRGETGRGAVWLACRSGGPKAPGSNPGVPTAGSSN